MKGFILFIVINLINTSSIGYYELDGFFCPPGISRINCISEKKFSYYCDDLDTKRLNRNTCVFYCKKHGAVVEQMSCDEGTDGRYVSMMNCIYFTNSFGCEWYTNCLDQKYPCGDKGYAIDYGFKYCSKFNENISKFNAQGQEWVRNTMDCLKSTLAKEIVPYFDKNCDIIRKTAFDSHPPCYIQNGFCELFTDVTNYPTLFSAFYTIFDIKDFFSSEAGKQVFQTIFKCSTDIIVKVFKYLKIGFNEIKDYLKDLKDDIKELIKNI